MRLAPLLLAALLAAPASPARADADASDLPERYRQWLEEVEILISKEEQQGFLALDADHQRDAFIESFWKARDPDPETARNGFRDAWHERVELVRAEYGNLKEDRARITLLNGAPEFKEKISCQLVLHPVEVWHYPWTERVGREVQLLFLWRHGLPPPRFWTPQDGYLALFSEPKHILEQRCRNGAGTGVVPRRDFRAGQADGGNDLSFGCAMFLLTDVCGFRRGELVQDAVISLETEEETGGSVETLLARLGSAPEPEQEEWLATFAAHSTAVPEGAELFDADLEVRFPGRHQSRTVVDVELHVPRSEATPSELGEHSSYDFVLTGEVLRQGELFDGFRYSFGVPEDGAPEVLPMVFRRYLRPGEYRLAMKLEDVHGQRFFRGEIPLDVPREPPLPDPGEEAWATEAETTLAPGDGEGPEPAVELQTQATGILVGSVRFDAVVRAGAVDKLGFWLDGSPVLSRSRPPYTVELQLGDAPRPHTVRAVAYDRDGREVATDEMAINSGENRFAVRIVEPRSGSAVEGLVPLRAEVEVPSDAVLDRLELFLGDTRVATLHQAPFVQPVEVPPGPRFLRAVAYLRDGGATEDTVVVNVEGAVEEVNVELVELYATVLDRDGRAVSGLAAEDFRVFEDGEPQEIVRFEPVADRPVQLAVVVDASASMAEHLPRVRRAAVGFLDSFLTPRDRAALVVFNDRPRLLEKLTGDVGALAEELAGFTAEGNTALWDSVIFALHHLGGIQGQRALLLLTDGKDETSRFDFEQALAYARAMGTTIYTIGIGTEAVTRRHLAQLSEESGGRSFRIEGSDELEAVYRTIATELRAGYLLVYQSPRSDGDRSFRRVEAEVDRSGHHVRTIRGYFP